MGGVKENEDVMAARDFIQREKNCTWWGCEEGSLCFFWRCSRELRYAIRYGKRKWKVGPWNRFVQTQREVREE